jgi:hypothetical protein
MLALHDPLDRRQGEHVRRLAIGLHDERALWRIYDRGRDLPAQFPSPQGGRNHASRHIQTTYETSLTSFAQPEKELRPSSHDKSNDRSSPSRIE